MPFVGGKDLVVTDFHVDKLRFL